MLRTCIRISRRFHLADKIIKYQPIFLLICASFVLLYFLMIQLEFKVTIRKKIKQESLKVCFQDCYVKESGIHHKNVKLLENVKYILLWTTQDIDPFRSFEEGQRAFIKNNCSDINCYVTNDKNFFSGNISRFDVVAFHGRHMLSSQLPTKRSPNQKYIFFNMESSDNFPVCEPEFDSFFNWSSTYKLDSDIPYPYFIIKNKLGEVVGPQTNMRWPHKFPEVDDVLAAKLTNKSTTAAWFASNCYSRSGRDSLVQRLNRALRRFGLAVDVYGSCGMLQCPRYISDSCNFMLERDYFFYMALENSLVEDYVTEKVLRALQHDIVPIVYGGANYSRFLPPGSYIDVRNHTMFELATIIFGLINSPKVYSNFFRWKSLYTYSDPTSKENVCAVCAAINNKQMMETKSTYYEFRKWWNSSFKRRCKSPTI